MATRTIPAGRAPTEPSTSDLRVVDGLVQLSFLIQSVLARVAAAHELSIIQARLLGVLRDREVGMLDLSRILELEKSSVTGLVDRAERRGLVRRVAVADDGRAVRVILTSEGRDRVRTAADQVTAAIAVLVAGLSTTEQKRLSHIATTLVLDAAASHGVRL